MGGGRMSTLRRGDVELAVTELGAAGPAVVLLHGLAGSSRELLPTARALADDCHVILVDQRGHGASTRRPADLSRAAFVDDVVAVVETYAERPVSLVGQSMGAHTAMLVASARPDLVDRLVMLEGHAAGSDNPDDARDLGAFFGSWPRPFADAAHARSHLGTSALADAWIADLERTPHGLVPRFDADVMTRTITAVHEPRWAEWERLEPPTLTIFGERGMFSDVDKDALIARRPGTRRVDLPGGSHDAHLDAFEEWIGALRDFVRADQSAS